MNVDFDIFKASLFSIEAPVLMRIHFTSSDYPMPDEVARILDNAGHAVLIVGWDETGFVIHDPWDRESWGGKRGGANCKITYATLRDAGGPVNSTLDFVGAFPRLQLRCIPPSKVPLADREVEVGIHYALPGLPSLHGKYLGQVDFRAILKTDRDGLNEIVTPTDHKRSKDGFSGTFTWTLNTGRRIGSREFMAVVQASFELPKRAWERNNLFDESITVDECAEFRIDVKNPDWFPLYGRA